jgi:hypothetical protein
MGGTSLIATKLIALIEDKFKVKAQFATLFRKPTIAELMSTIGESIGKAGAAQGARGTGVDVDARERLRVNGAVERV